MWNTEIMVLIIYLDFDGFDLSKTEIRIGINEEFSIGKSQLRGNTQMHSHTFLFCIGYTYFSLRYPSMSGKNPLELYLR